MLQARALTFPLLLHLQAALAERTAAVPTATAAESGQRATAAELRCAGMETDLRRVVDRLAAADAEAARQLQVADEAARQSDARVAAAELLAADLTARCAALEAERVRLQNNLAAAELHAVELEELCEGLTAGKRRQGASTVEASVDATTDLRETTAELQCLASELADAALESNGLRASLEEARAAAISVPRPSKASWSFEDGITCGITCQ
jgi:hypothetical protein